LLTLATEQLYMLTIGPQSWNEAKYNMAIGTLDKCTSVSDCEYSGYSYTRHESSVV